MEVLEISAKEYSNYFNKPNIIFGTPAFNELNRSKVESVHYLVFKDSKVRMGICCGVSNNEIKSPFSSPFAGFESISSGINIETIFKSIEVFTVWCQSKSIKSIRIILPPSIYGESVLSKLSHGLFMNGYNIKNFDLNYSFALKNFNENYISSIKSNARKNLKYSQGVGFKFAKCKDSDEFETAYQIIKENRESKGYPLRMSLEDLNRTSEIIKIDAFILKEPNEENVAAAIVFHVTPSIAQVVYWGDRPGFSHLRCMNYLSYKVLEHYKNECLEFLDIGPSTENSIPNFGLCEFKESIGCDITPKLTFKKIIEHV